MNSGALRRALRAAVGVLLRPALALACAATARTGTAY